MIEHRDGPTIKIAAGIYSFLTRDELTELRRCVGLAYPTLSAADRNSRFITLACQPNAAAKFVQHPHFKEIRQ